SSFPGRSEVSLVTTSGVYERPTAMSKATMGHRRADRGAHLVAAPTLVSGPPGFVGGPSGRATRTGLLTGLHLGQQLEDVTVMSRPFAHARGGGPAPRGSGRRRRFHAVAAGRLDSPADEGP